MKVKNWSPMMRAQGFDVIHYGIEGSESGATEDVNLATQEEHLGWLGLPHYHAEPTRLIGDYARSDSECYRQFNFRLRDELRNRLEPGDVLCLPFQSAHDAAWKGLAIIESGEVQVIETGIGYPKPATMTRVYESEAWRHWTLGNEALEGFGLHLQRGVRREWVVPNYYRVEDWPLTSHAELSETDRNTVVFLGRIEEVKGVALIPELAKRRPDLHFVICGQGNPEPFLTEPNIEYRAPISGSARAVYLGHARCGLFPSRYIEPFCGSAVECMMTGSMAVSVDCGAMTETIIDGVTGVRCRTLAGWLKAIDDAPYFDRAEVRRRTVERYSLAAVGRLYARVFEELTAT